VDQAVAEPIIAVFEQQSGIKVKARFDTEASKTVGLVQRIRSEASSPIADVFWSGEVFYTIRLAREGLLAAYHGESTNGWPKTFADPQGRWYGFALRARVIAYNTKRVLAEQAPRRLEDLLDSNWKGRLVMASPEFGTTGGDVASWFVHYGQARAREILQGLRTNGIRLVSGNSTAVRMVATGQADVCFTDTDDVYAAQRNGWPVAMNYLDQDGRGPLAIPNTAAVIAGAPHPNEARVLMEFLLSEQLEEMLAASDSHNCPIHPAVAQEFQRYAIAQPLEIDYEKVADELPKSIEIAREILR
jgi:iron(III) transport system substrate-binding protein